MTGGPLVIHSDAPAGLGCWWCARRGVQRAADHVLTWGDRAELRDLAAGRAGACAPCRRWMARVVSTHTSAAVLAAAEIEAA